MKKVEKVDLSIVKLVLEEKIPDEQKRNDVLVEIIKTAEAEKEDEKGKSPPKKSRFVALMEKKFFDAAQAENIQFFLAKVPEDFSHDESVINEEVLKGMQFYNKTRKAKKVAAKTLADAAELVKKSHYNKNDAIQNVRFLSPDAISITPILIP